MNLRNKRAAGILVLAFGCWAGLSFAHDGSENSTLPVLPAATVPAIAPHLQGFRNGTIAGKSVDVRPILHSASNSGSADDENLVMGNPSNASHDGETPENYLLVKPEYAISYNENTHNPNWVSWHLNSSWVGPQARANDFRADPDLPEGFIAVNPKDYGNSGFDKGHMCNSKDRTRDATSNSATFLMSNMVPQSPRNNQQTWKRLEDFSRKLADKGDELFIVSGPAGKGGEGKNGPKDSLPMIRNKAKVGEITVPKCTWKVILDLPHGRTSPQDVTDSAEMIAVIMPNNQSLDTDWHKYAVSVDQVEALTHYEFFNAVDGPIAATLKHKNESAAPTNCK